MISKEKFSMPYLRKALYKGYLYLGEFGFYDALICYRHLFSGQTDEPI
jgi:hypothetical protein